VSGAGPAPAPLPATASLLTVAVPTITPDASLDPAAPRPHPDALPPDTWHWAPGGGMRFPLAQETLSAGLFARGACTGPCAGSRGGAKTQADTQADAASPRHHMDRAAAARQAVLLYARAAALNAGSGSADAACALARMSEVGWDGRRDIVTIRHAEVASGSGGRDAAEAADAALSGRFAGERAAGGDGAGGALDDAEDEESPVVPVDYLDYDPDESPWVTQALDDDDEDDDDDDEDDEVGEEADDNTGAASAADSSAAAAEETQQPVQAGGEGGEAWAQAQHAAAKRAARRRLQRGASTHAAAPPAAPAGAESGAAHTGKRQAAAAAASERRRRKGGAKGGSKGGAGRTRRSRRLRSPLRALVRPVTRWMRRVWRTLPLPRFKRHAEAGVRKAGAAVRAAASAVEAVWPERLTLWARALTGGADSGAGSSTGGGGSGRVDTQKEEEEEDDDTSQSFGTPLTSDSVLDMDDAAHVQCCFERPQDEARFRQYLPAPGRGGWVVEPNMGRSVRLFSAAAAMGNATAQFTVGVLYSQGLFGFPVDERRAVTHLFFAHQAGSTEASAALGERYSGSITAGGVAQDVAFRKCAASASYLQVTARAAIRQLEDSHGLLGWAPPLHRERLSPDAVDALKVELTRAGASLAHATALDLEGGVIPLDRASQLEQQWHEAARARQSNTAPDAATAAASTEEDRNTGQDWKRRVRELLTALRRVTGHAGTEGADGNPFAPSSPTAAGGDEAGGDPTGEAEVRSSKTGAQAPPPPPSAFRRLDSAMLGYYHNAADHGEQEAHVALGHLYLLGTREITRDAQLSSEHFHRAAAQGDLISLTALGSMYLHGIGVPSDYALALEFLKDPLAAGIPAAVNAVGYMHRHGLGMPRNDAKAFEHFTRAANTGYQEAAYNRALMLFDGTASRAGQRDFRGAMAVWADLATKGHLRSLYKTGVLFLSGVGGQRDCVQAVRAFRGVLTRLPVTAAAEDAWALLARANPAAALLEFAKAAELGFEVAQWNAAYLLHHATELVPEAVRLHARAKKVYSQSLHSVMRQATSAAGADAAQSAAETTTPQATAAFTQQPTATRGAGTEEGTWSLAESTRQAAALARATWHVLINATVSALEQAHSWVGLTGAPPTPAGLYKRALRLYLAAAAQGNGHADLAIGNAFYHGHANRYPNPTAASERFLSACNHRVAEACFSLAYLHEHGLGVARDRVLAKRYYDQALDASMMSSRVATAHLPIRLALLRVTAADRWHAFRTETLLPMAARLPLRGLDSEIAAATTDERLGPRVHALVRAVARGLHYLGLRRAAREVAVFVDDPSILQFTPAEERMSLQTLLIENSLSLIESARRQVSTLFASVQSAAARSGSGAASTSGTGKGGAANAKNRASPIKGKAAADSEKRRAKLTAAIERAEKARAKRKRRGGSVFGALAAFWQSLLDQLALTLEWADASIRPYVAEAVEFAQAPAWVEEAALNDPLFVSLVATLIPITLLRSLISFGRRRGQ
jgi:TPR repeat protein